METDKLYKINPQKYIVNGNKIMLINNSFIYKWAKSSNEKTKIR